MEHCTRTVRTFDHDVKRPHKVDGHEQKRQRSGDSHDEPQDLGGLATKRERVGLRDSAHELGSSCVAHQSQPKQDHMGPRENFFLMFCPHTHGVENQGCSDESNSKNQHNSSVLLAPLESIAQRVGCPINQMVEPPVYKLTPSWS